MKVKNIAFSGIMAAILMGTAGANAAVEIASKQYVISQTSNKATTTALTEGLATKADKEAFETLQDAVNSTESGLATKASTTALESGLALKANAADVYTIEQADDKFQTLKKAAEDATAATNYTNEKVQQLADTLGGVGEDGQQSGLVSTVTSQGNKISTLEGLVGDTAVATQISNAITELNLANTYDAKGAASDAETAAKSYTDQQVAALSADGGALTTLAAKVTANEGAIATNATEIAKKADKTAVEALSGQISALGDTYATDAEVEGIRTTLQGNIDAKVATSDYNTKVGELETAIAGNKTATETNAAAIKTINDGAVMNSGITSEKVGQYDKAVTDLTKKITMPEICMSKNCVLSTLNGEIQWVEITIPVGNE